jgi:hypothetical protein
MLGPFWTPITTGFEAFARLLGITVSGSKASMLKQVKDFVNRAAVIQDRTRF